MTNQEQVQEPINQETQTADQQETVAIEEQILNGE